MRLPPNTFCYEDVRLRAAAGWQKHAPFDKTSFYDGLEVTQLFHAIAYIVVKSIIPDIAYHKARIQKNKLRLKKHGMEMRCG
jgi:hypothetical protein